MSKHSTLTRSSASCIARRNGDQTRPDTSTVFPLVTSRVLDWRRFWCDFISKACTRCWARDDKVQVKASSSSRPGEALTGWLRDSTLPPTSDSVWAILLECRERRDGFPRYQLPACWAQASHRGSQLLQPVMRASDVASTACWSRSVTNCRQSPRVNSAVNVSVLQCKVIRVAELTDRLHR